MPNFEIKPTGPLSKLALKKGLSNFDELCHYVADLPYGRNANRTDFNLVLKEEKGTCSSKHALLQEIALENKSEDWHLVIGIYKMSEENTPGVGTILESHKLPYIPEAHCYLKNDGKRYDFTKSNANIEGVEKVLLQEEEIIPEQVISDKVQIHQTFLKSWLKEQESWPDYESIWGIREACIRALSS